jgi:hypothetical protein
MTKTKKTRKLKTIIIVIVLFVIGGGLGVGGYYLLRPAERPVETAGTNAAPAPAETKNDAPSTDQPAAQVPDKTNAEEIADKTYATPVETSDETKTPQITFATYKNGELDTAAIFSEKVGGECALYNNDGARIATARIIITNQYSCVFSVKTDFTSKVKITNLNGSHESAGTELGVEKL